MTPNRETPDLGRDPGPREDPRSDQVIRTTIGDGDTQETETSALPVEIMIGSSGVDVRLLDQDGTHIASAYVEYHGNRIRLVVSDEDSGDDETEVIVLVEDVARALVPSVEPK